MLAAIAVAAPSAHAQINPANQINWPTGATGCYYQPGGNTCTVPASGSGLPVCADTSGSGTAQSCTTSPTFTPVANSCVIYDTTTSNSGTALTINVNSLGAKSVAKWQASTTLVAGDVAANKPVLACYDGTNWNLSTIGNAPSGGGGGALTAVTSVQVNGTNCAIEWENSAGTVVKIELFACSAITDYSNGSTAGSIEWAINQLGTNGGLISLHPGIYNTAATILIDWDWITIEGTELPYWSASGPSWPTHATAGTPGGAQIVSSGSYSTFTIGNTSANMHGDSRHKGIQIDKLYPYGAYITGTSFIKDATPTQNDDWIRLQDNTIQGMMSCAIQEEWDTHYIIHNTIQNNGGDGVCEAAGSYSIISQNIIYDNGGEGVTLSGGVNTIVSENQFGHLTSPGTLSGGSGEFIDNVLGSNTSGLTNSTSSWIVGGYAVNGTATGSPYEAQSPADSNANAFQYTDKGAAATFMNAGQWWAPNVGTGDNVSIGVGQSFSATNEIFLTMHYAGSGSSNNYTCFNYFAGACIFEMWPNGNIGIGYNASTAPPSPYSYTGAAQIPAFFSSTNATDTEFELCNASTSGRCFSFYSNGSSGGVGYGGLFDHTNNGDAYAFLEGANGTFNLHAGSVFGITSNTTRADVAPDTGWSRCAANVFCIGNGTNGDKSGTAEVAQVQAGILYSAAGTALPTCASGNKGAEAVVSDATSPTYLGTYTSGGAVLSPVVCNGSNWLTY